VSEYNSETDVDDFATKHQICDKIILLAEQPKLATKIGEILYGETRSDGVFTNTT
jgi:hypothetical protein